MSDAMRIIHDKLDDLKEGQHRLDRRVVEIHGDVRRNTADVADIKGEFERHTNEEHQAMMNLAADVHYLRGVTEERGKQRSKHPVWRAICWIARLFGIKLE